METPELEFARENMIPYLKGELDEAARRRMEMALAADPSCRAEMEVACRVLAITDSASEPATDRIVDELLAAAISERASDIHLEPQSEGMRIRFRVDGRLSTHSTLTSPLQGAALARIKLRSGMDLTETRRSQQGRFDFPHEGQSYEIRGGTISDQYGERMTLRILNRAKRLPNLDDLGFPPDVQAVMQRWTQQPRGLILTSGLAGSGKLLLANSLIQEAASAENNAMAIVHAVAFEIENVSQVDLMSAGQISYKEALRAIMAHQDPDIMMIEELPDEETAVEVMEAALTGHLLIVGISAKTGPGAVRKLLEMTGETEPLAEALVGVVSQRLARRVCPECAESVTGDPEALEKLGLDPYTPVKKENGCPACEGTGWKGRLALHSLLDFSGGQLQRLLLPLERDEFLKGVAEGEARTYRQSAAEAVQSGQTTPEEALQRVGDLI